MSFDIFVLTMDPLAGLIPQDIPSWVDTHTTEKDLATAYAIISNHVGSLMHELDRNDLWIDYTYDLWKECEIDLYHRIKTLMTGTISTSKGCHGSYQAILPFMERNGYRFGAGWWIKASKHSE